MRSFTLPASLSDRVHRRPGLAEDLTQETRLRLYRRPRALEDQALVELALGGVVPRATVTLNIVADDTDTGDTLAYATIDLPAFATLTDHGDRTATLEISSADGDIGEYQGVVVVVTDDGVPPLSDSEIFIITVADGVPTACRRSSGSRSSLRTRTLLRGPFLPTSSTSGQWLGGQPGFSVFRSDDPLTVLDPVNELGQTSGRNWTDVPPPGEIFFFRVTRP